MGEVTLLPLIFFVLLATIMVLALEKQHTFIIKGSVPDVENWHTLEKLTYGNIIFMHFLSVVYSGNTNYQGVYICIRKGKLIHSGS